MKKVVALVTVVAMLFLAVGAGAVVIWNSIADSSSSDSGSSTQAPRVERE